MEGEVLWADGGLRRRFHLSNQLIFNWQVCVRKFIIYGSGFPASAPAAAAQLGGP